MSKDHMLLAERMRRFLGEEYEAFARACDGPPVSGVRVNTLKLSVDQFRGMTPFALEPVPWCREGFYVSSRDRPGKHPYYHAGLYYVQEPSAMAPVELLGVRPGDRVLDLCAAPGGKSVQIACKLERRGLLVANDRHPQRVAALVKNLELAGVPNAVVVNEDAVRLAGAFRGRFDKILVDAPCSGEARIRKSGESVKTRGWRASADYAALQQTLLDAAADMLAPGGVMVYSTCTFAPEENEAVVLGCLARRRDLDVVEPTRFPGFSSGRPDWVGAAGEREAEILRKTVRIWPHATRGEGHFVAVFRKISDEPFGRPGRTLPQTGAAVDELSQFETEAVLAALSEAIDWPGVRRSGRFVRLGDAVSLLLEECAAFAELFAGLRVVRAGLHVGDFKPGGRFRLSHALALAHPFARAKRTVGFRADGADSERELVRYLKGESLFVPAERIDRDVGVSPEGIVLVEADGFPIGWAKWQDGLLKNGYPAGWRWAP